MEKNGENSGRKGGGHPKVSGSLKSSLCQGVSKEEFLEMVKVADREIKRNKR